MPQVIMLTHAAHVNRQRVKIRADAEAATDDRPAAERPTTDMPTYRGKPIDQLTSEEYAAYLMTD